MIKYTTLSFFLGFVVFIGVVGLRPKPNTPPNIVLIFADDMGYGDITCFGGLETQTPNLDKMAVEGIRFTNFLVAQAVCSASRTALLSGCYPNRVGIVGALMPTATIGINTKEELLPELLKAKGYATGIFGKWHLGHHKEFLPLQHGFDEYYGLPYSNDMWPVGFDGKPALDGFKKSYPVLPLIEGNEKVSEVKTPTDQDKLTTVYTERAVSFIERHKKQPFFLYVPHSMPHIPLGVSDKFRGKCKQGLYGDMLMEFDWSVGQILKSLKDNGLDKNTLVIFTSDNGPWLNFGNHAGSTGGLREGKGTTFEGGHRVPCIVRWPSVVPAGLVCDKLTTTMDILPTVAKLCGAELPKQKIDGVDIVELLKGSPTATPRKYFYYYYNRNSLEAVRRDNWKLVLDHPQSQGYTDMLPKNDGFPGPFYKGQVPQALYDLRRDGGERYDVQKLYPEIVIELQKIAEEARTDLGDDVTNRTGANVREGGKIEVKK